ncbi:MAG: hypothetical protein ABS935_02965 [Solibacillus sp.]|uniref:hypothetical protein n=1 Tax=Solibacillus sp. TaxID=1909654 RepID=UPI00331527B1
MIEKLYIDTLTNDNVSIRRQQFTIIDGNEYSTSHTWRRAYVNSLQGRISVENEVPEPYKIAIFAVWGDAPTVDENNTIY